MSQLFIENPCSENWSRMQSNAAGRYCAVCSTSVVDFTSKTESEILDYFSSRKEVHICGRYRAEQVSTPRSIRFKWALITLALIFGTGFISSCRKHVQGRMKYTLPSDKPETETSKRDSSGTNQH